MSVLVIGGGPSGLIAAEVLAGAGLQVTVADHMPSVGRKFLLAGRGGLNLTHSEPLDELLARYRTTSPMVVDAVRAWPPSAVREWAAGLGEPTFIGSSGRVFPQSFRATPLLRAWVARLTAVGVRWLPRHRWTGWRPDGGPALQGPDGPVRFAADATVLALGGGSWMRTGSDATWVLPLAASGVHVVALQPANSGFAVDWSPHFAERFAGVPLKNVRLQFGGDSARGEAMITASGIEGGAVYALGAAVRDAVSRGERAVVRIDLQPDITDDEFARRFAVTRPSDSLSNRLRRLGLSPVAIALVHETAPLPGTKVVSVALRAPHPLARSISTAGGVSFDELDDHFMLRRCPGVFVAGEMLDWEAPTGGYLLQACLSTGVAAARGAIAWLATGATVVGNDGRPADRRVPSMTDQNEINKKIAEEFRAHGGKVGGRFEGVPMVLLTTIGAKSGQQRLNPLVYLPHDGRIIIFASKAGAPSNPDWYHNLMANPKVIAEVGTERFGATAKVITGPERDQMWAEQVAAMPGFKTYAESTSRLIPVIELVRD